MVYSTQTEVETWSQIASTDLGSIGHTHADSIAYFTENADHSIDEYCNVPDGFFDAGGVTVTDEYHDGASLGYHGYFIIYNKYLAPLLMLKYRPVISVTTLKEEVTAGSWTTRTEGQDDDYLVIEEGVRFLRNLPKYKWKNIKVTYVAGYAATPPAVSDVSAQLSALIIHRVLDGKSRSSGSVGGLSASTPEQFMNLANAELTPRMKNRLKPYRSRLPPLLL